MSCSEAAQANFLLAVEFMEGFDVEVGLEEDCRSVCLAALRKSETIFCNHCEYENTLPDTDERMIACNRCRKEIWITAGTFFHHVRKFRPLLAIICLVSEGIIINANQAAKLLGVSSDTTNKILRKLGVVVLGQMGNETMEVSSEQFLSIYCRRSRETPAREHPVQEEFAMRKNAEDIDCQSKAGSECDADLSADERTILDMLSQSPIGFDQLCEQSAFDPGKLSSSLISLELLGLLARQPGDKFVLGNSMQNTHAVKVGLQDDRGNSRLIVTSIVYFVKDHFQGISRKYLQLYTPLYWISFDRVRWKTHSLLTLCATSSHIRYQEILEFVTPLMVKIVPRYSKS